MSDQPFDQEEEQETTSLESMLARVHAEPVMIAVDFPALEKKLVLKKCDIHPELVDVMTLDMATDDIVDYACGLEDGDAAMRFAKADFIEKVVMAKGLQGLLSS